MNRFEFTSRDKRIKVVISVYKTPGPMRKAYTKCSGDQACENTQGGASTHLIVDYKKGKRPFRRTESYIFLHRKWCTYGVVAHEINHIAHHLAKYHPRPGISAEELRCSFLDTLVDLFMPLFLKHRIIHTKRESYHSFTGT